MKLKPDAVDYVTGEVIGVDLKDSIEDTTIVGLSIAITVIGAQTGAEDIMFHTIIRMEAGSIPVVTILMQLPESTETGILAIKRPSRKVSGTLHAAEKHSESTYAEEL